MSELARIDAPKNNLPKYAHDTDRPYVGDPWSRQPTESAKAFDCFTIYLKLEGDRTIAEASRRYGQKYGTKTNVASQWSARHRWVERAEAFDSFMMAKQIRVLQRRKVDAAVRHADAAEAAQSIVMLPIAELRKRIAEEGGALSAISELDEVSLIKLYKALGGGSELAGLQKAERDAIGSVSESSTADTKVIAERGIRLKEILSNPKLVELYERVMIERSGETVEGEAVED